MDELRVKDLMTTGVIHVTKKDKVDKAVDIMTDRSISCIVVVESEEHPNPIGIITERDLVRRVLATGKSPKKITAESVMTKSLVTISEQATLEEAMREMENMRIRRLPVINHKGLVGLVTQTDVVKETANIQRANTRLVFHQNIQSYVIIGLAIVFLIAFFIRMWG